MLSGLILGLDLMRVTHPNRAKGLRVRGSLVGSVRHPAFRLSPAAACRSGTRAPGTLASVQILGHFQESKDSNTEKQARTTEFTEQTKIAALRAERHCFLLRELRGPRLFLRVGILAFLDMTQDPDGCQCPWRPRARATGSRGRKRNRGMPN